MASTAVARPGKTFSQKLHSRRGREVGCILAFATIPVFLLILFTYFPFAEMVKFSFFKMKYIGPRKFVGFDNYAQIFNRSFK